MVFALLKLRPYPLGAEFVVYTDHKPLMNLFTKEMKNTKVQRWAVLLEEGVIGESSVMFGVVECESGYAISNRVRGRPAG